MMWGLFGWSMEPATKEEEGGHGDHGDEHDEPGDGGTEETEEVSA